MPCDRLDLFFFCFNYFVIFFLFVFLPLGITASSRHLFGNLSNPFHLENVHAPRPRKWRISEFSSGVPLRKSATYIQLLIPKEEEPNVRVIRPNKRIVRVNINCSDTLCMLMFLKSRYFSLKMQRDFVASKIGADC